MGGRGSTRWGGHTKRPLVEEALAVDLGALRLAGLHEQPGTALPVTWTRGSGDAVVASGRVRLLVGAEQRHLDVEIAVSGAPEPLSARLELVAFRPSLGGTRWYLRCPEDSCGRRALRLYVSPEAARIGCRQCLRLVHRTAQQHDARLDQARRDPKGFAAGRDALQTARSMLVTLRISQSAIEQNVKPRRGRCWGRRSVTVHERVFHELALEYEARWGQPLPSPSTQSDSTPHGLWRDHGVG